MYKKGDIVERLNQSSYNLSRLSQVRQQHFKSSEIPCASNLDPTSDIEVVFADEDGAVVKYSQKNYTTLGHLYYENQYLKLVKRPDMVVNDYSIF